MYLPPKISLYLRLMRFDRPVGTWLLLWHTLWALWIAARGLPSFSILVLFILGVIVMRAAGCVINDMVDYQLDRHVERTRHRPLASGALSLRSAFILLLILLLMAFILVLFMNRFTIALSFIGAFLAALYPWMKRVTHFPQFFFGLAWSWSIPMVFAAQTGEIPPLAWLLYATVIAWGLAYDTIYALCDMKDDVKIGIKSTAVFAGSDAAWFIGFFQALTLGLLYLVGHFAELRAPYFISLVLVLGQFVYQQIQIVDRDPARCLAAFKQNTWVGATVFIGVFLGV